MDFYLYRRSSSSCQNIGKYFILQGNLLCLLYLLNAKPFYLKCFCHHERGYHGLVIAANPASFPLSLFEVALHFATQLSFHRTTCTYFPIDFFQRFTLLPFQSCYLYSSGISYPRYICIHFKHFSAYLFISNHFPDKGF